MPLVLWMPSSFSMSSLSSDTTLRFSAMRVAVTDLGRGVMPRAAAVRQRMLQLLPTPTHLGS